MVLKKKTLMVFLLDFAEKLRHVTLVDLAEIVHKKIYIRIAILSMRFFSRFNLLE